MLDQLKANNRELGGAQDRGGCRVFQAAGGAAGAGIFLDRLFRQPGARRTRSSDLDPGEMFVHRNVANLAPPQDANYLSVLQFAVDVLKVKHILVVGHYGCGGVRAAVDGQRRGLVDHWLHPIREVCEAHRAELEALPEPARLDRLCELNVMQPGAQRGGRPVRAGCLGARAGAGDPWLGLFDRQMGW